MIRSTRDIVLAYDEGRVHVQRFAKNAGAIGDLQWQDWSFASGQPAYDARIGDGLTFTPAVAARNDAIFFPPAPEFDRRISEVEIVTVASTAGQLSVDFHLYDLIGYYPLIDGDSTDLQVFDNTLPLPRYATGEGVRAVVVNHIAPALSVANMTANYTDSDGVSRSAVWPVTTIGAGKVAYTPGTGATPALYAALAQWSRGVRSVDSVQFDAAPGGLWAVYLVKPLMAFSNWAGLSPMTAVKPTWPNMPKVEDGAFLGMFYMPNGAGRSVAMHGNITFVWG